MENKSFFSPPNGSEDKQDVYISLLFLRMVLHMLMISKNLVHTDEIDLISL